MSTYKPKWQYSTAVDGRRIFARNARREIIVRIENVGDDTKYAEWSMPKILGLSLAAEQANLQTKDEDIRE